jgi:RNA polymerase sigma factor (TIGR02999 family)
MSDITPEPDSVTATNLMELVYDQLRKVAQQRLGEERTGHTLQATALVHEVYLKLSQNRHTPWSSRGEFYAAAAEAMRRILVDHARGRNTQKRGGGRPRAPLSVADLADQQDPALILALDDAVSRLETEEPRAAAVLPPEVRRGRSLRQLRQLHHRASAKRRRFRVLPAEVRRWMSLKFARSGCCE